MIDLVYYHDKSIEEIALIVGAPKGPSRRASSTRAESSRSSRRPPGSTEDGHDDESERGARRG